MPAPAVTLYSDYKSPYSYLAQEPAYEIEREFGIEIGFRPFIFDIPESFGDLDRRTDAQWRKVRYLYRDVRRFANQRGMTILGPQKLFDSRPAAIGMLYAQAQGCFRAYNDAVFSRFFHRELDIGETALVKSVLAEVGADVGGFDGFAAGPGNEAIDRIQNEALEQGIFGVPTFVIGDELFWGHDRIDFVRQALESAAS